VKNPLIINTDNRGYSGIQIDYVKTRKTFFVSGWYNSCVGIQGREITLKELLEHFKITVKDCQKVMEE